MILPFEDFEKAINSCLELTALSESLEKLLGAESFLTFDHVYIQNTLSLLKFVFADEAEWIEYWAYDLDWGARADELTAWDKEDNLIPLKTVEDLYNLLVKNLKDK